MPVLERSLVEKVGMAAGGAPLGLFDPLKGWAATVAVVKIAANPAISRDVSSRVFGAYIAYCRTPRCAWLSRMLALRPGVANLTSRTRPVRLVATDAARHAGDAGVLRHSVHLRHLAVAHHALQAGCQMPAVRPGHARSDLIDALPWNRLAGAREFRELYDRRPLFGDGIVACHADRGGRERHLISWFRIGMASPAFQAERDVGLVAVRQRLHGRGMRRDVFGNFLFRSGC